MRPFGGALGLAVFFHLIGVIMAAGLIIRPPPLNNLPPTLVKSAYMALRPRLYLPLLGTDPASG